MMGSKAGGQRWKIIAPFLRPLRTVTFLQLDERVREGHLQSSCAGLVLTLPVVSTTDDQRRLRTALELLHTLWTLDREAWRRAISDDSGVGIDFPGSFVLLSQDETPHVVVSVKHDKFPWQIQSHARWNELLKPQATLFPPEAETAKELLLRKYGANADDVPKTIPLVLQFLMLGLATSVIEAYLCSIVSMVEDVQKCLTADPSSRFQLSWLDLELSQCEMTSRRARQVARLHALGIPFRELTLRLFEIDGREQLIPAEDCAQLLATLVGPSQQAAYPFSVETLVVDKADLDQFGSVCTAIERTKCVKNLQLNNVFTFDTPTDRITKWQWLTRALFASASQSSIKHLSLQQFEFHATDATNVHDELESIQAANVDEIHEHHTLETLTIRTEACQVETIETIPALVSLIGTNLRCLSIYAWVGSFTTASVRDILIACRQLELLDLSCLVLDSFDVFYEAYDNLNCKIRSLALHEVEIPSVHVTGLAQALRDPNRRCAQVLFELCLDSVGDETSLNEANLDGFLLLLQTNKTLEYLELRAPDPLRSIYRPLFDKHDQTWLPKPAAQLMNSCKASFLSVTRPIRRNPHQDSQPTQVPPVHESSIPALDDRVVSLIFAFAATRAKRTVWIGEA